MFEKTHGKHPVIVLKDIKKEVFEALLKYMYIGEAWPMAIKDEPTDEPQSEANEGSGACATEFLDRNNGDCKEDEGGAGSAEDALPALPDPAGGEPSGDSQGAAHKDPSDLIDSKVEVGDIEEAPDDWESSLLNKDDEGQEGEALTSMLSGDDASNAAADTPTPGVSASCPMMS
ncbi:hypothetical protein HAZT_HAZT011728 [Hyalella azteca]|uniref:BTB domain-containing protein n=1 Tax=Hyalella azteca TaxID=294128 RepID=A0A6A0H4C0_HYAAZ|nr:hypothetical protein HAZT_HAZT011728 [Hyalella azteca]